MNVKLTQVSSTLLKGKITETKVLTYFLELGYVPSVPEVPCQYDFLLDVNGKILKIQVKTCKEKDGYIKFSTVSITHNNNGYIMREYDPSMIDYFCTFYNDVCYLIPFSECGKREKRLRVEPTKNNQIKNISFAKDYIAADILKNIS